VVGGATRLEGGAARAAALAVRTRFSRRRHFASKKTCEDLLMISGALDCCDSIFWLSAVCMVDFLNVY